MMEDHVLRKNSEYHVESLDGEAILYRAEEGKIIGLNQTSYLIWELCDESRTLHAITA